MRVLALALMAACLTLLGLQAADAGTRAVAGLPPRPIAIASVRLDRAAAAVRLDLLGVRVEAPVPQPALAALETARQTWREATRRALRRLSKARASLHQPPRPPMI